MSLELPTISVIIPVLNEEKNLKRLFASLISQTYPEIKLEYIVVDDASIDKGPEIARSFGAKVIPVNTHDIELNKGIGMHKATGDLVYWLDADMEICNDDFFELLAKPHIGKEEIIGSFTNEFALDCGKPVKNSLLRFISYDELQRDPLYQFFSPSIESTVINKKNGFSICNFTPGKIPPAGRMMYKRLKLLRTQVGKNKSFIDLESLEMVTRAGYTTFAYVPKAKIRHYHADSLTQLIKKRLRNLERDYLPNIGSKYYTWFDTEKPESLIKIIFWVIYTNLFFPELLRGIYKSFQKKDIACLWQPVVSITTTDAIIYGFLSKQKGREFATNLIKSLIAK